jgi:hypothetical protein
MIPPTTPVSERSGVRDQEVLLPDVRLGLLLSPQPLLLSGVGPSLAGRFRQAIDPSEALFCVRRGGLDNMCVTYGRRQYLSFATTVY